MSTKVTLSQLRKQLPALLDRAVERDEECIVQRNGKDYAVIISARQWRRQTVGKRLDAIGASVRLPKDKQSRAEELLEKRQQRQLTSAERRELASLLRECDTILGRRAAALDRLP